MACSDCYNGCTEIVSDKCVKYTGVDIPILEVQKGDSLSYVTQALVTFLTSTINGTGIKIEIAEEDYCNLVSQYLQECSTVTALDLFKALVKAACNVQGQIDTINSTLTTLNGDYNVDCLDGVTNSSDTHLVVQAIIDKLCAIDVALTQLASDVDTQYVKISDINDYIAAYIASTSTANRYSSRMVPYSIIPFYGSLSGFDGTGAGLTGTEWEDIYLCNGLNGTPDLRGRTIVGVVAGIPGGALSSIVNPASSAFNPNYSLGTLAGANSVTLTEAQIPPHDHNATVNDPGHDHTPLGGGAFGLWDADQGTSGGAVGTVDPLAGVGTTSEELTGVTVTIANAGGGEAHSNIQPSLAMYYIMYIPS